MQLRSVRVCEALLRACEARLEMLGRRVRALGRVFARVRLLAHYGVRTRQRGCVVL